MSKQGSTELRLHGAYRGAQLKSMGTHFGQQLGTLAKFAFCTTVCLFVSSLSAQPAPVPVVNGVATVTASWTRPTTKTDGTPLPSGDIDGYVLYYGQQSKIDRCQPGPMQKLDVSCYQTAIDITNGAATAREFTLSISADSTYYFALSTYDEAGALSDYSNELARVFDVDVEEPPTSDPNPPAVINLSIVVSCTTNDPNISCTLTVQ